MEPAVARRMWRLLEPYYEVLSALDRKQMLEAIGLKGGWMTYFGARAAPMGAVAPEVVIATFYVFAPDMVRRAIPDAWRYSTPEKILSARLDVVDTVLRRRLGEETLASPAVAEAARIARAAAESCSPGGRPLFEANMVLPWPEPPHLQLWHATNLLREFRGDGHMACLFSMGLDGCEAHVTLVAARPEETYYQKNFRGWTGDEWEAAERRLQSRGWLQPDASFTERGREARRELEHQTDRLALEPWSHLGHRGVERLEELVSPMGPLLQGEGG